MRSTPAGCRPPSENQEYRINQAIGNTEIRGRGKWTMGYTWGGWRSGHSTHCFSMSLRSVSTLSAIRFPVAMTSVVWHCGWWESWLSNSTGWLPNGRFLPILQSLYLFQLLVSILMLLWLNLIWQIRLLYECSFLCWVFTNYNNDRNSLFLQPILWIFVTVTNLSDSLIKGKVVYIIFISKKQILNGEYWRFFLSGCDLNWCDMLIIWLQEEKICWRIHSRVD